MTEKSSQRHRRAMTQLGILAPVPTHSRFMFFDLVQPEVLVPALQALNQSSWLEDVIGFGPELMSRLERPISGFSGFPSIEGGKVPLPNTQHDLLVVLRGDDRGDLIQRGDFISANLSPAFALRDCENAFKFRDGRDLSGYVDGTENPEDTAREVALIQGAGPGIDGGSFVAIQTFVHDLDYFRSLPTSTQDNIIGRRISDNEEFDSAPENAHVKRTAQESFDPDAFILRRSMPYQRGAESGLVFVAYGRNLDAYSAILRRMIGAEDGLVDALFSFSRPRTGGAYFCPPTQADKLDLRALIA